MSATSSLEVYRSVTLPEDCKIIEEISAVGDAFFMSQGSSAVGIGPNNRVHSTFNRNALYRPTDKLSYYHLSISGRNAKHFGRKMTDAIDRLVGGADLQDDSYETPLAGQIANLLINKKHPELVDQPISLTLDDVVELEYPSMFPGKRIVALIATEKKNRFEPSLLEQMSLAAQELATGNSRALKRTSCDSIVNSIPIAEIDDTVSWGAINEFSETVRDQLLPLLGVSLGKIKIVEESQY